MAVAGERNAVRLGNVRQLDVRASRDFTVGRGSLRFFTEVMNITDRINPCCLVYEPVTLPNGQPSLVGDEQGQAGLDRQSRLVVAVLSRAASRRPGHSLRPPRK